MGLTSRDKTHCVNGHRRTPKNLYTRPSNGTRGCRICREACDARLRVERNVRRLKERLRKDATRPFKKPSVRELGWAAGCFDGEGTVTIGGAGFRNFPQSRVLLTNTDREVVDFYVKRWGGRIRPRKHPSERSRRPYEWAVWARNMRWFLRDILPHVQRSVVREKISIVLEIEKMRISAPKARLTRRLVRRAVKRLRRLNRRGRAVPVRHKHGG